MKAKKNLPVRYHQLILRLGVYESSRISQVSVTTNIEGGFESWQEAIVHFRQVLIAVAKSNLNQAIKCYRCPLMDSVAKFCDQCGKLLSKSDDPTNSDITQMFREFFEMENQQIGDEVFEESGWLAGG